MDEQKLDVTAQQPDTALHAQTEEITNEALPEALLEQQAAQAELSQAIEGRADHAAGACDGGGYPLPQQRQDLFL